MPGWKYLINFTRAKNCLLLFIVFWTGSAHFFGSTTGQEPFPLCPCSPSCLLWPFCLSTLGLQGPGLKEKSPLCEGARMCSWANDGGKYQTDLQTVCVNRPEIWLMDPELAYSARHALAVLQAITAADLQEMAGCHCAHCAMPIGWTRKLITQIC